VHVPAYFVVVSNLENSFRSDKATLPLPRFSKFEPASLAGKRTLLPGKLDGEWRVLARGPKPHSLEVVDRFVRYFVIGTVIGRGRGEIGPFGIITP
jgi:hypothetical protein